MSANEETGKVYRSAVHIQIGGSRNRDNNGGSLEFRIDLNNRVSTPDGAEKQKQKPADVEFPPEFGVKPRRQFVDEGQPAKFKVSVEGLPKPDVTWSKNGKNLQNDSNAKIYEDGEYHYLELQTVIAQDKGQYSCLLTNKLGTTEASAELNVFEKPAVSSKKPSGPSVLTPLQDTTTVEGEKRFVLDCSFADAADCSATWFKDGEEVKPGRELRARFDGRVASLTISRVLEEDIGTYECLVTEPTGEARTKCNLNVEVSNEKREPPKFVRELHDMEVNNGDKVELLVEVKGSETIDVFWIHNNREVTPQDTVCHVSSVGNVHKLVIPSVCLQDAGEYVCEAYSDFGDTDTFCRLTVRDLDVPAPPEFVSSPRLLTAEEGSSAMYSCRVKGHPMPKVSWEKDGIAIKENSHFKTSIHGDEYILEVLNTTKSDAGSYTCRLQNPRGETSHTASLVVTEKADFRTVLKTRSNLGKLGKQNSTDSEKSDKENDTDFRKVLRRGDRTTPPGGLDDRRTHKVQQLDFRNVLKTRPEKIDPVLPAKLRPTENVSETLIVKSRDTIVHTKDLPLVHKKEVVTTETKAISKHVQQPKSALKEKVVEEEFVHSTKVSLKKTPEENSLKNRLSKFEQHKKNETPTSSVVKKFTTPGSIQGKLNKFEQRDTPEYSRPTVNKLEQKVTPEYSRPMVNKLEQKVTPEYSRPTVNKLEQKVTPEYSRPTVSNFEPKVTPEYSRPTVNKFEHRDTPEYSRPTVKTNNFEQKVTPESQKVKLNKFELKVTPEDSKAKVQSGNSLPNTKPSVLGRLNKFEKLSEATPTPANKVSTDLSMSKPRGTVHDKYSFTEKKNSNLQNGKSDSWRSDNKLNNSEKSLKSRMEKFEKKTDSSGGTSTPSKDRNSSVDKSLRSDLDRVNILTNRPREVVQPPEIKRPLNDQRVRYGHQVVLECEVTTGTVNWSVNGKDIKGSKFFKMSMSEENIAKLTIAETYSEDEGEYMCTATNKYGSVSSSCKLFVDGAASSMSSRSDIEGAVTTPARLLSVSPTSVAVLGGQKVTIEAVFSGDPKPEVRWFRGRDEIQKEGRINIETTSDRSILTIDDVNPDDAGKYIVAIENHADKDSLCTSVSVEDIPDPPGMPQANDVMRSSIILWWCGSPYDGGSQITHYKVEVKKYGDSNWSMLTSNCKNTFYQVEGLEEKTAYYFRVYSANKHGFSEAGEMSNKIFTSAMKISLDYESDGAPEVFSPVESKFEDELPFEPRAVEVDPAKKFEDHYDMLHEVGKGKFGNVYQCKDKTSGKIWAAKILKCREKEKANIRHEIEIMNDLAHPKLMMIWDAFEAPRCMTLVMEFVGGGELFERVISDDFELTEGDCVHFMRQICDGVAYMHDKGIMHLDLKPENILCISNHTNQIKIIDFGLARRYMDGKSIKVLFGTPEFIAPEVINYDEISLATDMWSLGVICYLLLSGLSPFLGDNDAETLANVTLGEYDFDDESFDDITDNAKDFIQCLLIKNKDKRHLIKPAQQHVWLAQDERRIRNKRLNTDRLKKFMARRKWQKTGTAIRAIGRMASLQRLMSGSSLGSYRDRVGSSASDSSSSACWETDSCASDKPNFSSPSKVHDDVDDIDSKETSAVPVQDSNEREVTLQAGETTLDSRDTTQKTLSPDEKKPCSDHNGNIAIKKQIEANGETCPPKFLKEMLDCEAFTGDVIRFDVRVAGSPEPEFHWLHEDEEVQEDSRHIVEISDNGQCSLIIRNVGDVDDGEYCCVAVNSHGEVSCSAELIVCNIGAV